jgi:hypothetical protein
MTNQKRHLNRRLNNNVEKSDIQKNGAQSCWVHTTKIASHRVNNILFRRLCRNLGEFRYMAPISNLKNGL